jgi:hypothetical protein
MISFFEISQVNGCSVQGLFVSGFGFGWLAASKTLTFSAVRSFDKPMSLS